MKKNTILLIVIITCLLLIGIGIFFAVRQKKEPNVNIPEDTENFLVVLSDLAFSFPENDKLKVCSSLEEDCFISLKKLKEVFNKDYSEFTDEHGCDIEQSGILFKSKDSKDRYSIKLDCKS